MAVFTDMNLTMFWLIVLVALVVIELLTMGLTTVWFAGGALIATIAAVFHTPFFLQVILFLAVSAVLLILQDPWRSSILTRTGSGPMRRVWWDIRRS